MLAAALFANGEGSWRETLGRVESMTAQERRQLSDVLLAGRGPHDVPLRALEHTSYVFEVVIDQGGYFEFKRHRIMTQTPQRLTTRLGYAVPRLMAEAGWERSYREALDAAGDDLSKNWRPGIPTWRPTSFRMPFAAES